MGFRFLGRYSALTVLIGFSFLSASAQEPEDWKAALRGAWFGEVQHNGTTSNFGLELKEDDAGLFKVFLFGNDFGPVERVGPNDYRMGGERMRLIDDGEVLQGVVPAVSAPVHRIPFLFRRYDPSQNPSQTPQEAPQSTVSPVWRFKANAPIWGSASLAGGKVFFGDYSGVVHALDTATGEEVWNFATGGPVLARPTWNDGYVYASSDSGMLFKLDAETGMSAWNFELHAGGFARKLSGVPNTDSDSYGSAATIVDGVVYIGSGDGSLYALNERTGGLLWKFATAGRIRSTPVVSEGAVFFGSWDGNVYSLDLKGELLWKYDTGSAVPSTPAVANGRVLVGSRSFDMFSIHAFTGSLDWMTYLPFSWVESHVNFRDGVVYVGSSFADIVRAVDATNGNVLWTTRIGGHGWCGPISTEDTVYMGAAGKENGLNGSYGGLLALDRQTGDIKWRYITLDSLDPTNAGVVGSAVVDEEKVYFGAMDGYFYAFAQ